MDEIRHSTGLTNTYGDVEIIGRTEDGYIKFYWLLGDCFGDDIQEIPEYLYSAILRFIYERKIDNA
jgi:hypothetical protein